MLDNIIILALIFGSFCFGKHISDKYHERIESEYEYIVRLNAAQHGVGYVAPRRVEKRMPIGQQFMDKLAQTGRATTKITK